MSLPKGAASISGLAETKRAMSALEEKMRELFPRELQALLKAEPEVKSVSWRQLSESGFRREPLDLKGTRKLKRPERNKMLDEITRLITPMPSSVLLRLFGHYSTTTFTAEGHDTEYEDDPLGGYGAPRDRVTPGVIRLSSSPLGECFQEYYQLRDEAVKVTPRVLLAYAEESKEKFEAIQWEQYTSHFIDGDACSFHVQRITLKLPGSSEFLDQYDVEKEQRAIFTEVEAAFDSIHSTIFYQLYGDHKRVTLEGGTLTATPHEDHN